MKKFIDKGKEYILNVSPLAPIIVEVIELRDEGAYEVKQIKTEKTIIVKSYE